MWITALWCCFMQVHIFKFFVFILWYRIKISTVSRRRVSQNLIVFMRQCKVHLLTEKRHLSYLWVNYRNTSPSVYLLKDGIYKKLKVRMNSLLFPLNWRLFAIVIIANVNPALFTLVTKTWQIESSRLCEW